LALDLDPPSPEALEALARGFAPDPVLKPSEWAEAKLILPNVTASRPGPFRWAFAPYGIDVIDALAPTAPWRLVVLMSSGQVAKTTIGLAWAGYVIDQHPGPMLHVQPTVNTAKRLMKTKLEPIIKATPCLAAKVGPSRSRDATNTRLSKEFPNGILHATGANSPAELAGMSARDTHLDEVDRFPRDVGEEGDPTDLSEVRQETFEDGKTLMTSTPTTKGLSRIDLALEQCDVEMRFHVPCPLCGHRQALVFEQLRWPEGRPDDATYECIACRAQIPHGRKRTMVRAGAWVAIRDNGKRESIGFHIWQAYSLLGRTTWGGIARKYERAKGQPERERTFVNTVLGLPYQEAHEAPEWRILADRREPYPIGEVPTGGLFLTAGADLQRNPPRLEVEVVAWGYGKERWSIDYQVLPLAEVTTAAIKAALDPVLATDWPCADGRTLPIRVFAIDSGLGGRRRLRLGARASTAGGRSGRRRGDAASDRRRREGRGQLGADRSDAAEGERRGAEARPQGRARRDVDREARHVRRAPAGAADRRRADPRRAVSARVSPSPEPCGRVLSAADVEPADHALLEARRGEAGVQEGPEHGGRSARLRRLQPRGRDHLRARPLQRTRLADPRGEDGAAGREAGARVLAAPAGRRRATAGGPAAHGAASGLSAATDSLGAHAALGGMVTRMDATRRVLYLRDDGTLAAAVDEVAREVRTRTGINVTAAQVARSLLHAALASPAIRKQVGGAPSARRNWAPRIRASNASTR
jgi:phage terminase large subunit GpA-like protein